LCQSRGFDIIALAPEIFSPGVPNLKSRQMAAFSLLSVLFKIATTPADIHRNLASSDLILIKLPIEPLWFKHERLLRGQ
jgi:hypothetical protein